MRATGTRGELLVAEILIGKGFHVSLPLDETQFDLVATSGSKSFRLQVKCTSKPINDWRRTVRYNFNITRGNSTKKAYTFDDCDFLICIALDTHRFWVIPIGDVGASSLKIAACAESKYSKYEGRWDLLN